MTFNNQEKWVTWSSKNINRVKTNWTNVIVFIYFQPHLISDVNLFKRELGLFPLPKPFISVPSHKAKLWLSFCDKIVLADKTYSFNFKVLKIFALCSRTVSTCNTKLWLLFSTYMYLLVLFLKKKSIFNKYFLFNFLFVEEASYYKF